MGREEEHTYNRRLGLVTSYLHRYILVSQFIPLIDAIRTLIYVVKFESSIYIGIDKCVCRYYAVPIVWDADATDIMPIR